MPRIGETWRTRVGPYRVRIIDDTARGNYPLVGLIEMGDRDVAWNFSLEGGTRDPYDNGFDLVQRADEVSPGLINQPIEDILKLWERADD